MSKRNLIIIGPPGSGKSTQAELLSQRLGLPFVSTGAIFRALAREKGREAVLVKSHLDLGQILSDKLTISLLQRHLGQEQFAAGFVGEGFPRTRVQAEKMLENIALAFYLRVRDEKVVERLSSRRVCSHCGENYNLLTKPPQKSGACDRCQAQLGQRDDDKPEVITERLRVYHQQTEPMLAVLRSQGILVEVDGEKSIAEIQQEISSVLAKKGLVDG